MAEKEQKDVQDSNRMAKPGITVELIVGDQWVDDLSGISLYRGFYHLASTDEIRKSRSARETGYVREKEEKQPTAVLPKDKNLSRVEKALRLGILKIYDPKNPTVYVERSEAPQRKMYDDSVDSGSKFKTVEDEKLNNLLKMKLPNFILEIKKFKSLAMLEKIYDLECEGGNPTAAARKAYVDAIRSRMAESDVSGVGGIKSKVSEIIKFE